MERRIDTLIVQLHALSAGGLGEWDGPERGVGEGGDWIRETAVESHDTGDVVGCRLERDSDRVVVEDGVRVGGGAIEQEAGKQTQWLVQCVSQDCRAEV